MNMLENFQPQGRAPAPVYACPTWAPAAKDAVGTALGTSRLWFTVAQGIITEVYYPRPDIPQLKDMGFIVADNTGFWVELRRLGNYTVAWQDEAIPAIIITHRHARFTFTLKICADPERDVLLLDFSLAGDASLQLYVLAALRIGEDATCNQAWANEWEGRPLLWAAQGPYGLALAAIDCEGRPALLQRSVGLVGASDGWQDFQRNGCMTWHYAEAGPGEVALTAQLPRAGALALGLSSSREAAATLALQSLAAGFETRWAAYCQGWRQWLATVRWPPELKTLDVESLALLRRSAAVIKSHEDRTFPGAFVASLSVPWGEASNSRGGYHLVWARDLVETAGALMALGCLVDAQRILIYLIATQQANGHWLQNQWLGGKPFWQGIQLDETAFPVLLASALAERDALCEVRVGDMVRRALGFIAREGPVTCQDRWEEDAGINTFTVAVAIAALVEGSRFLAGREADCALMLADAWNARLEDWTWAADTALARQLGVPGYYMRSAPQDVLIHEGAKLEHLLVKNRAHDLGLAADEQLAIDCLQLARFGLRGVNDPAMASSIRPPLMCCLKPIRRMGRCGIAIMATAMANIPDGAPFDGWGRGRGWPLLTGERGHIALLAGSDTRPYLQAMTQMAGKGGLLPEQVWDSAAIPERGLYPGQPSGSAMPLVWAHAEFIKLALSLAAGAPVDRPVQTWTRYGGVRPQLDYALWQPRQRVQHLIAGQELRLLLSEPALVHWGNNGWQNPMDVATEDWGLGHVAQLPTTQLLTGEHIDFTFYWPGRDVWQGENFQVIIIPGAPL